MLTNCVSTVRGCRGILLFVALVSLVSRLPAQDRSCKVQSDQVPGSAWGRIPPPPGDMIVAFYENCAVMVGLNHVYVVQITSGWSTFSFHPGFTAREEIPLKFHVLSDNVYTIQPERPLDDGEYLVIFGPSAVSGFEFQIACSSAHCE